MGQGRGRGKPSSTFNEDTAFLSYKFLETMSTQPEEQIIQRLYGFKKLTQTINNSTFSIGLYSMMIKLLHKLVTSQMESDIKNHIYIAFMDSQFFTQISQQFLDLEVITKACRGQQDYRQRLTDFCNLLEIFESFINQFRSKISKLPISNLVTFISDDLQILSS